MAPSGAFYFMEFFMMYSRKKNPKLLELQEKQRKEMDNAIKLKREANNHEEKLRIESRSRSTLNKMVDDFHKEDSAQIDLEESIQLKKTEEERKEEIFSELESAGLEMSEEDKLMSLEDLEDMLIDAKLESEE